MDQPLRATGAFTGYEDELLEILKRAGGEWGIAIEALDGKDSIYLSEEAPLLSASVIKIPIMMAAFHEAREGRIRRDDTYILRSQDKVEAPACSRSPFGLR